MPMIVPAQYKFAVFSSDSQINILGVKLDVVDVHSLLARAAALIDANAQGTIMYLNVHVANTAQKSAELANALNRADLVYCDGWGVRLAARVFGAKAPQRMTGADFIGDLADLASRRRWRVFWIGGKPGVAADATAALQMQHPYLQIVGTHHGYFDQQGPENESVLWKIADAKPHLLIVGMGTPTQELWVNCYRSRLAAPLVWCLGATADYLAGDVRRGPRWMTDHGLEWLFRLALEPRRMFRRYVVGNPLFAVRILRNWSRWRSRSH